MSLTHKINRNDYKSLLTFGYENPIPKKHIGEKNMQFPEGKGKMIKSTVDEYFTPKEPGDVIVGVYTDSFEQEFGTTYILDTGEKRVGLPNHKYLQGLMQRVEKGSIVRVIFTGHGDAKDDQQPPKLYTVEAAK